METVLEDNLKEIKVIVKKYIVCITFEMASVSYIQSAAEISDHFQIVIT